MVSLNSKSSGFTIVELLIVIVVIGILAAVSIVAFNGVQRRSAESAVQAELRNAINKLELHKVDNNETYPSSLASAGIQNTSTTIYEYTYTSGSNSYCISATSTYSGASSFYVSSTGSRSPLAGLCPGHTGGTPVEDFARYFDVGGDNGGGNTCIVSSANVLRCAGYNQYGELGNGTSGTSAYSRVFTAVNQTGVLNGKTIQAIDVSGSGRSVCVIADSAPFCWGRNDYGQIGNGLTGSFYTTPQAVDMTGVLSGKTVTDIAVGGWHACVIADGLPYCWGRNINGSLGNGSLTSANQYSPVAVVSSGVLLGKTAIKITTDYLNTCVLTTDANVYCWGAAPVGNNTSTDAAQPVGISRPGDLATKTITDVAAGQFVRCIIADGDVYCWGGNNISWGTLGNNLTPSTSNVPIMLQGSLAGLDATAVSVGTGAGCALANGQPHCWGYNMYGAIGDGTSGTNRTVPTASVTSGALAGKSLRAIANGTYNTCALDASRDIFCWGYNGTGGALGNNTSANVLAPLLVTP